MLHGPRAIYNVLSLFSHIIEMHYFQSLPPPPKIQGGKTIYRNLATLTEKVLNTRPAVGRAEGITL